MTTLVTGIGLLVTNDPAWESAGQSTAELGEVRDAAIVIDGPRIAWVGRRLHAPDADERVDLEGACVIPGFVDSHSHPVFAGERSDEFAARMEGRRYEAGGIMRTVTATRAASDEELRATITRVRAEMLADGTTTFEAKTGYGLDVVTEARLASIAAQFTPEVTFLGAHVVGPEWRDDPDGYVDLVCGPMLAACAPHCRWADVFCETGAFDPDQSLAVLRAAAASGLELRLHAAQLGPTSIIADAVGLGVASIDHCTFLSDADVAALAGSQTVATLLPAAEFSTRQPYPSARRLLDAGATVALATDCNPGTAYTGSMSFCLAVAVREMGMTPAEALWAATAGGARALRRDDVGVLRPGAAADLVALAAPSWLHLMYRPGVPLVSSVWRAGVRWRGPAAGRGACSEPSGG
jgi:imidazolonepropionase